MPNKREALICGSIDLQTFDESRDIIRITDKRVEWESDSDRNDSEDDHLMHRYAAARFIRLVNLVRKKGGRLKVTDAYRPHGVHMKTSLHKEGRALDLTCTGITHEELAKLCWAAGFDWVYNERGNMGGHVHCSVSRTRPD